MTPSKIIRSKRKTLSLTINENAELVVRAPIRLSIEKIQDFINEKEKWIRTKTKLIEDQLKNCLLYTSPSPRDRSLSRMPSSA